MPLSVVEVLVFPFQQKLAPSKSLFDGCSGHDPFSGRHDSVSDFVEVELLGHHLLLGPALLDDRLRRHNHGPLEGLHEFGSLLARHLLHCVRLGPLLVPVVPVLLGLVLQVAGIDLERGEDPLLFRGDTQACLHRLELNAQRIDLPTPPLLLHLVAAGALDRQPSLRTHVCLIMLVARVVGRSTFGNCLPWLALMRFALVLLPLLECESLLLLLLEFQA
mmetsp:Transcript_102606/g.328754  ORF Transcript_102606/g.328754 Transcript_102606/m.328754 type:complete len:219 (+) Transcript_102606:5289-5945(+)